MYAGLAIYDTMQFIKPDVQTICVGMAMRMGAIVLAGGAPGKRSALPQLEDPDPPGARRLPRPGDRDRDPGARGDQPAAAMDEIMANHTGQALEKVTKDTDRDFFMTSEEAKEYGLIDRVIEHR